MIYWALGLLGIGLLLFSLLLDDLLDNLDFGSGWLSGTAIGGFLAALGFVGGIADINGLPPALTAIVALAAGAVFGLGAAFLARSLGKQGSGSTFRQDDLVGLQGLVVTTINGPAAGEISVKVNGVPLKLHARADQAVPTGTPVVITAAMSATTVHVRTLPR